MEGGHIHCMKKKDNIIKFKPKKPKPMKYWLCEFFKRYGEDENTYHYIFSDKNIKDMKYKGNGDDHKILSQFFLQKITPLAKEGSSYWTTDGMSLVRFDGMQEVKPIEFDILRKARVYVNGDFLPFKQQEDK